MDRKLRILHIEDRFHPQMGYQLNYLMKYHADSYEFHLLTSDSFSLWKGFDYSQIRKEDEQLEKKYRIKIYRLTSCFDRPGKHNIWLKNLVKEIHHIAPDIIFIHAFENITGFRLLSNRKILRKYNIAIDTHTLYNQFRTNIIFQLYFFLIRHFVVKKINKFNIKTFYTVTENKKILKDTYKINEQHIFPFPIGTDCSDFYFCDKSRQELRMKYHIPSEAVVLMYAGKINNLKKPHLIFDAVKKIDLHKEPILYIVFIGSKDEAYFQEKVEDNFVELVNFIYVEPQKSSELYKYYSFADFVIFPAENTLSALDAQACRLPVIMEDDTTNRERLAEGGLLYESGNLNDLADKIYTFLRDEELRKEKGRRGQEYVRKNYDYRVIIKKMEGCLMAGFH